MQRSEIKKKRLVVFLLLFGFLNSSIFLSANILENNIDNSQILDNAQNTLKLSDNFDTNIDNWIEKEDTKALYTEENLKTPIQDNFEISMKSDFTPISANSIKERPSTGNVSVLAMPVYFLDQDFTKVSSEIDAVWDEDIASVKEYYLENSFNQLEISVTTLNWVMVSDLITYYADDEYQYPREFDLTDILVEYWDNSIDFNDYDYLYVVYAGNDAVDDSHFWPHVWTFYEGGYIAGDGVIYDKLGFVGEFSGLGTYSHEFGHSLGLVDYYSEGSEFPVGYWELMGVGGYNDGGDHPAHLSAYSKIELGWITSDQILIQDIATITNVQLMPLEVPYLMDDEGCYYAVKIPYSDTSYYLIEYRDSVGYDEYLPDHGVLWSFVDLTKGSTEGRLTYIGGDHSSPDLEGVELDDTETENSENFSNWLVGDFELCVSAINESYNSYVGCNLMEVLVDTLNDYGTEFNVYEDLHAGNMLVWTLEDLKYGEIIFFRWDTPFESSGSNMRIEKYNGGSWDIIYSNNDIFQDAVLFAITESDNDDYRVIVSNNNILMDMDVYYKMEIFDAAHYILTDFQAVSSIYLIDEPVIFNVSFTITNIGEGWYENYDIAHIEVAIILPSELSVYENEDSFCYWVYPFGGMSRDFNFQITADEFGTFQYDIFYGNFDAINVESHTIEILEDDLAPTINDISVVKNGRGNYEFYIEAIDDISGIEKVEIFIEDQEYHTIYYQSSNIYSFVANDDLLYNTLGITNSADLTMKIVVTDNVGNVYEENFSPEPDKVSMKSWATSSTDGNITYEWNPSLFASEYLVYYYTSPIIFINSSHILVDTIEETEISFIIPESGIYYVLIVARNSAGSEFSENFEMIVEIPKSIPSYPIAFILINMGIALIYLRRKLIIYKKD